MSDKIFGIDISKYQRGIDFDTVADEEVAFTIIKASQQDFADPEFERHYANAKKRGIKVGAYHYLKAVSDAEALSHAKYLIDNCLKGKVFEYPIFVDVEDPSLRALSKGALTGIVKTFLNALESAGYWAGFYTNLDWYTNCIDGAALAERYSFWFAYWGKTMPLKCQMWQFGGEVNLLRSNRIAGVTCDQDFCFVDYPKMIAEKGLNGMKKTSSAKTKTAKKASSTAKAQVTPSAKSAIKVGDKVKIKKGALVWGSTAKFADWVFGSELYVREVSGDRIVISTLKTGAVTGAVDAKYVIK